MREKIICEKCGSEMEYFIKDSTCGAICKSCGWGYATTYQEPIKLDHTEYTLIVQPIENPSVDILRCMTHLLACNFLVAKRKLQETVLFVDKAITILDIAAELKKHDIPFVITPDFPYGLQ